MSINYYPGIERLKVFLLNAGSPTLAVNGSVTPVVFEYAPGPGEIYYIDRLNLIMSASGNLQGSEDFFTQNNPLTNGILFERQRDGLTALSVVIKTNFEILSRVGGGFQEKILGNDSILVAETFTNDDDVVLDGNKGDWFRVTVRDNLTFLTDGVVTLDGSLRTT